MKWATFLIFWIACGFYSWGTGMANLHYFDAHVIKDPRLGPRDNIGIVAAMSALGPIGMIATAVDSNFNQHGWELWWTQEEQDRP